jgi:hypothetical protein
LLPSNAAFPRRVLDLATRSIQARSHLGDAGIGARLILFATRGTGDADRADYLVANLDRYPARRR